MTTTHALSFKKSETRNPEPPGLVCTLAVASTTEQALGATCFPGHLPQAEERYVTDCCAAQVQSTGRWARLVRSGGAARTKRSRRPPRWKHATRGCLTDSDPAGDGRRGKMLEDLMHLTASLDPTPMRKLYRHARSAADGAHLSRPKGIGVRCIPHSSSRRFESGTFALAMSAHAASTGVGRIFRSGFFFGQCIERPPGCGIYIGNKSGQRGQKSFEKLQKLQKGTDRLAGYRRKGTIKAPYGGLHFKSRALTLNFSLALLLLFG